MTTLNIKVCPLPPGDVCLSFDASETTNYLITGTLSGKVYVFDNSHVFSLLSLTKSLPCYNPTPSVPWKTDSGLSYTFLSPCQTISLVGKLDQRKDFIDHNNIDSVIDASQWDRIPSYTPIKQKFPLAIDCNDQFITQSDLDHVNRLYFYNQQQQQQPQQQQPQHQHSQLHSSLLPASSSRSSPANTRSLQPQHEQPPPSATNEPFDPLREVYIQPTHYTCKKLIEANNEPVKSIYIVPNIPSSAQGPLQSGSFVMALGDVMLKVGPNITTSALLNMKYQRTHTAELCQSTYPLPHQALGALVVPGSDQLRPIILDGVSQRQTALTSLPIPLTATPLYLYNSNFYNAVLRPIATPNQLTIAWREFLDFYQCTVLLLASATSQKVSDALYFSETKRPIGFKQSGNRIVSIVEANYIQINNPMPITITQSAEDWYQLEDQRRAVLAGIQSKSTHGEITDSVSDGQEPETVESIEAQQMNYRVDELLVNGCLLDRLSARKAVHERELSSTKGILTPLITQLQQLSTTKVDSKVPSDDNKVLALNLAQRIDLSTIYSLNPMLFTSRNSLPNGVLAQYTTSDAPLSPTQSKKQLENSQPQQKGHDDDDDEKDRNMSKSRAFTHSSEGYPLPIKQSERRELYEVRNQLLTYSYVDWLSDQPIVNQSNSTYHTHIPSQQLKNQSKGASLNNNNNPVATTAAKQLPRTSPKSNGGVVQLTPLTNPNDLKTYPAPPQHLSLELAGKTTDISLWSHVGHVIPPNELNPDSFGSRTAQRDEKNTTKVDVKVGPPPHAHAMEELSIHSKSFRCVKFRAHKRGYILGMDTDFDGALVITIATDYKIKVWYKGKLLCKYSNVLGNLICSSVVLIKRIGRVIYYSCTDGIYCVVLPFEVVVDVIGANLNTMITALTVEEGPIKPCDGKGFISPQLFNDVHSRGYTDIRFYTQSLHICGTDDHNGHCCFRGVVEDFGSGSQFRQVHCQVRGNDGANREDKTRNPNTNAYNDTVLDIKSGDFNNQSLYQDVVDGPPVRSISASLDSSHTISTSNNNTSHTNQSKSTQQSQLELQPSPTQLVTPQSDHLVGGAQFHTSSLSDGVGLDR